MRKMEKKKYQAPAATSITVVSQLLSGSSSGPSADFMQNPDLGEDDE